MTEGSTRSGYWAVIAVSTLKPMSASVQQRYLAMTDQMLDLARMQDGFLGREHARDPSLGISVSYWRSKEAIAAWRNHVHHVAVKEFGRKAVYQSWRIRICRVEEEYGSQIER